MNPREKRHFLLFLVSVILSLAMLCRPQLCVQGFQSGLHLCVNTVLPALFPFFVFCDLWMNTSWTGRISSIPARVFGLQHPSAGTVVLLAWIGGYAVCARLTGKLYREEKITKRDSALVMMLGCCSSPGFVIGCVGGLLLGNLQLGILLYGLQLGANLLSTAICLPFLPPRSEHLLHTNNPTLHHYNLPQAIASAVDSCTQVCGCILFFRTISTVIASYLPNFTFSRPLLNAALELTAGCTDFSALGGGYGLYGCCLCLSILGISVWSQISLLLQESVPIPLLLVNRCIHFAVFFLLIRLLVRFLPGIHTVYSTLAERVIPMQRLPFDAAVITFLFICCALYKVRQNFYNK